MSRNSYFDGILYPQTEKGYMENQEKDSTAALRHESLAVLLYRKAKK